MDGLQVGKASSLGKAEHRSRSPSLSCSVREKGEDSSGLSHDRENVSLLKVPTSQCENSTWE